MRNFRSFSFETCISSLPHGNREHSTSIPLNGGLGIASNPLADARAYATLPRLTKRYRRHPSFISLIIYSFQNNLQTKGLTIARPPWPRTRSVTRSVPPRQIYICRDALRSFPFARISGRTQTPLAFDVLIESFPSPAGFSSPADARDECGHGELGRNGGYRQLSGGRSREIPSSVSHEPRAKPSFAPLSAGNTARQHSDFSLSSAFLSTDSHLRRQRDG